MDLPSKGETKMSSIDNQMGVIVAGGGINVDAWIAIMQKESKCKVGDLITLDGGTKIVPITKV